MVDAQLERAPARRRFDVDEYYRLAEAGILGPDERVELLEGDVIVVPPLAPAHAAAIARTTELLSEGLRKRASIRNRSPLRLGHHSEPEPDVMLVRRRDDRYASGHATAEDTLLVIEIALDRAVKAPLYARHGVPELWLMDLAGRRVHVLREPGPGGFAREETLGPDDQLAVPGLPDLTLQVQDLWR